VLVGGAWGGSRGGAWSPPEELDEREGVEPASISIFTCVLRAMITQWFGCTAGDALLPALVAQHRNTTGKASVTVHAATDGQHGAAARTVGAAVHWARLGRTTLQPAVAGADEHCAKVAARRRSRGAGAEVHCATLGSTTLQPAVAVPMNTAPARAVRRRIRRGRRPRTLSEAWKHAEHPRAPVPRYIASAWAAPAARETDLVTIPVVVQSRRSHAGEKSNGRRGERPTGREGRPRRGIRRGAAS